MGYEKWKTTDLSPLRIDLDTQNPRLPRLRQGASQTETRSELFDTSKVREMVKSIGKSGFFPDQRIVVIRKESGRGYIAVEGNRRVCACQVLLKPVLSPEKHSRVVKRWAAAAEDFKPSFQKVPVVVAPSRLAAIKLMSSRHLNDAPVIRWSRYAQGRFAINALAEGQNIGEVMDETGLSEADVKKSIQEARIYELFLGLSWSEEERNIILDNLDSFPIEALWRLLRSKATHKEFGDITFDEEGWMIFNWQEGSIENALKRFLYDSHQALSSDKKPRLNSRTLNDSDGVKKYLSELPTEIRPSPSTQGVSAKALVPEGSEFPETGSVAPGSAKLRNMDAEKPKPTKKKKLYALPADIEFSIKNDKARALLDELQSLDPESYPNATGFLLRSLLEVSLIAKIKHVGKWRECITKYQRSKSEIPKLEDILKFAEKCELTIPDISLRRSLSNQYVVPRKLLNLVAHNDQHFFAASEAKEAANKMLPLFRALLSGDDRHREASA